MLFKRLKVCSHLAFAFAFASTSPSKFNIASMGTETQTHRMGLNPFLTFYIGVDANANANVKCEHTFSSRTSFSLEFRVLDTAGCVLHQNICFHPGTFANTLQMNKLNSLLEATRGSDRKDTSDLTMGCVQKLFLEGETRP